MSVQLGNIDPPDWITNNLNDATRRINPAHDDHTDRWDNHGSTWTLHVTTDRILINDEGPGQRETMPGLTRAQLEIRRTPETWDLEWDNYGKEWLPIRYTIERH